MTSSPPEFTEPSVENFLSDGASYYTRDKLIVWNQALSKWEEQDLPPGT
jgi:hypothetical protein